MAKKPPVHVVPDKKAGDWKVKQGGKTIDKASTKKEALKEGKKEAVKDKTELVEHGKDGKIRNKDSFGNDPYPPRG